MTRMCGSVALSLYKYYCIVFLTMILLSFIYLCCDWLLVLSVRVTPPAARPRQLSSESRRLMSQSVGKKTWR